MPLHQVSAQFTSESKRPFQIDFVPSSEAAEIGPFPGLGHDINREGIAVKLSYRQARSVDRDAPAGFHAGPDATSADNKPGRLRRDNLAYLFDNPGEHLYPLATLAF